MNTADQPIENAPIIAEEMLGWLQEIEGFEGLVLLSRPGTTLGLAFWESEEVAERHSVARQQFVERVMAVADVTLEERVGYEVTFAHVGPLMKDSTTP
ncbi:MAG TPA: hypothetical protein VE777_12005 [Gaiellales bacterium]|nr:hypothetical protein [Gaiellales bacterium]